MNLSDKNTYHIWRPNLFGIVQLAIRQRCNVDLFCHFPLNECESADVSLQGFFIKLTGQQAQYLVETFDLHDSFNFPKAPACEYRFAVILPKSETGKSKIEYTGKAVIIDEELQKNRLPESLLLRISLPSHIRPLRRHKRRDCSDGLFMMPGILLIDQPPSNRRRLLNLLSYYYKQKSRPRPRLINISAGGVCLETNDPACQKFMGADQHFLFFFFAEREDANKYLNVFLGKKVGIFRDGTSRPAGLRIRFLREMLWTEPLEELRWLDIELEGSQTIKNIIAAIDGECDEDSSPLII